MGEREIAVLWPSVPEAVVKIPALSQRPYDDFGSNIQPFSGGFAVSSSKSIVWSVGEEEKDGKGFES